MNITNIVQKHQKTNKINIGEDKIGQRKQNRTKIRLKDKILTNTKKGKANVTKIEQKYLQKPNNESTIWQVRPSLGKPGVHPEWETTGGQ